MAKTHLAAEGIKEMSQSPFSSQFLEPDLFGALMGTYHDIWQMSFLKADELAKFSEKRGVPWFERADIVQLWQLGWLRADLIKSPQAIQYPGIVAREEDSDDGYIYTDERSLPTGVMDGKDGIAKITLLPSGVDLLFHPFRYYILFQIGQQLSRNRLRRSMSFPLQHFTLPNVEGFMKWAHSNQAIDQVGKWDDSASIAVIAEPCIYGRIFHVLRMEMPASYENGWDTFYQLMDEHRKSVAELYQKIGIDRLKAIHQDLCYATQTLDPNEEIHTLLCLGQGDLRLKLEGRLGGAIFLRTMAEIVRRASEDAFGQLLQEEDECGIGWTPANGRYKIQHYGSDRLLDGDRHIANDFLRQLGLNYGFRLRWYVEGQTEWHALQLYFQNIGATDIDVVNLHGEVAQRAQRGIAFRESLRADVRLEVFSVVSIDGDVSENVRVLRKAAEDDEFCGQFFIAVPDFEFANFELAELEEILWEIAVEQGAGEDDRERLQQAIESAANASELLRCARQALPQCLGHIAKNALWAEHLMDYALEYPTKRAAMTSRPIRDAVQWALYVTREPNVESYKTIRQNYRVDKHTGELVPRSS
jgi:hypothetical protein